MLNSPICKKKFYCLLETKQKNNFIFPKFLDFSLCYGMSSMKMLDIFSTGYSTITSLNVINKTSPEKSEEFFTSPTVAGFSGHTIIKPSVEHGRAKLKWLPAG